MQTDTEQRMAAVALVVAGVCFVLYPALRPFADEDSLAGAEAFASGPWVIAHLLAVVAFILFSLGLSGVARRLQTRLARSSVVVSWIGVGLTLTYYGAEVFGLHAIGATVVEKQDVTLLRLADGVRFGPGISVLIAGLLLLTFGVLLTEIAVWRSGDLPRWSGLPLVVGFALYLPQYLASQPIRVAHAALITAGCFWIASALWRGDRRRVRGASK
jgi:hypothetical protein